MSKLRPIDWTLRVPVDLARVKKQVSGKFPVDEQEPYSILYRKSNGRITSYMVYDENGRGIKRVDLEGKSHSGIPTPHVAECLYNRSPDGQIYVKTGRKVRPARSDEIIESI